VQEYKSSLLPLFLHVQVKPAKTVKSGGYVFSTLGLVRQHLIGAGPSFDPGQE
jgi:hypothetical protein